MLATAAPRRRGRPPAVPPAVAQRIVDDHVRAVEAALPGSIEAFETLLDLFGFSLFADESVRTLHKPVREWLRDTLPHPSLDTATRVWSQAYGASQSLRAMTRRAFVQRRGLRPAMYGSLGAPVSLVRRPRFWKMRMEPHDYERKYYNEASSSQNVLLARAALVPFEKSIEQEYGVAEKALLAVAKKHGAAARPAIAAALDAAHLQVFISRYEGRTSIDFLRKHYDRYEKTLAQLK